MSRGVIGLVMVLGLAGLTHAEDWPRWRGPRGDGTWQGPNLPDRWPAGWPKIAWKVPIHGGYAGITAAEGLLATLDWKPDPAEKGFGTERVLVLDPGTGQTRWSHSYRVKYGDLGGYANGPRAAPTYHDGKFYTLGAVGHLICFEAKSGKIVWQHDTVKEYGARVPMWGCAASPLIDGDRVIVHLGAQPKGCYIAFDRLTGKELWRSLSDEAGYCTPIRIETKAGPQIIAWTPTNIHGLYPETGDKLWSVPHKITYGVSIATPIFRDDILLVSEYWDGSLAIRPGTKTTPAEVVWREKKTLRGLMAQPLYRDGFVYSLDRDLGLSCFEYKTGKKRWDDGNELTPAGRNPHASIVWLGNSDRVLAVNAVGELILARLTPEKPEILSRVSITKGRVWSHPAFADRFVYLRTDGGEQWQKGDPTELMAVELVPAP